MSLIQTTSEMSWVEVQFLKHGNVALPLSIIYQWLNLTLAVDVLCQCRQTLKWTYCFAFYLARNNMTELFEDNQADLEMAVESLSELCEKPIQAEEISKLKQLVLDKTVYVKSRRETVLEDTAKGLQEGRWEFSVSFA